MIICSEKKNFKTRRCHYSKQELFYIQMLKRNNTVVQTTQFLLTMSIKRSNSRFANYAPASLLHTKFSGNIFCICMAPQMKHKLHDLAASVFEWLFPNGLKSDGCLSIRFLCCFAKSLSVSYIFKVGLKCGLQNFRTISECFDWFISR